MKQNFPFTLRVLILVLAYHLLFFIVAFIGVTFQLKFVELVPWLYIIPVSPMLWLLLVAFIIELLRKRRHSQNPPNPEQALREKHVYATLTRIFNIIVVAYFVLLVAFVILVSIY